MLNEKQKEQVCKKYNWFQEAIEKLGTKNCHISCSLIIENDTLKLVKTHLETLGLFEQKQKQIIEFNESETMVIYKLFKFVKEAKSLKNKYKTKDIFDSIDRAFGGKK